MQTLQMSSGRAVWCPSWCPWGVMCTQLSAESNNSEPLLVYPGVRFLIVFRRNITLYKDIERYVTVDSDVFGFVL